MNPNVVVATEFMDFDPNHVHDGEFDVKMIDGWEQADPTLVQQSDQIIHDMVRTQCPKGRALTLDVINDDDFYDDWWRVVVHTTDFEHSATSHSDEGHSLIENQRPVIALRFDFFDVIYFASKKDVELSDLSRRLAVVC